MTSPFLLPLAPRRNAKNGSLIAIDGTELKMPIKRMFFIYGFDPVRRNEFRGNHGHENTTQILIAMHGTVTVIVNKSEMFFLDTPEKALVIPPNNYIQMTQFSPDAVLGVLCNTYFKDDIVYT